MPCNTCRFARPTIHPQRLHCMGPRSWRLYPASMPDWRTLPQAEAAHWESAIYYVSPDDGVGCPVYEAGGYPCTPARHPQGL